MNNPSEILSRIEHYLFQETNRRNLLKKIVKIHCHDPNITNKKGIKSYEVRGSTKIINRIRFLVGGLDGFTRQ